jgi:hypothetical protein
LVLLLFRRGRPRPGGLLGFPGSCGVAAVALIREKQARQTQLHLRAERRLVRDRGADMVLGHQLTQSGVGGRVFGIRLDSVAVSFADGDDGADVAVLGIG